MFPLYSKHIYSHTHAHIDGEITIMYQGFPEKQSQQNRWIDRQIDRQIDRRIDKVDTYQKELAHTIMKVHKSQDLLSASWRPRRANMQFHFESKGLRCRRADGVISSLKAGRFETQEEPVFQFSSSQKARKDPCTSSQQSSWSSSLSLRIFVLFRSSIDQMWPTHRSEGNGLYSV